MRRVIFLLLICIAAAACSNAQQYNVRMAFPHLQFDHPVGLYHAGDGTNRLFVVEQPGKIRFFPNDSNAANSGVFLDITDLVTYGGERGLLGLAFDPDFRHNGAFYLDFTRTVSNQLQTAIVRYKVKADSPNVADRASATVLLTIDQPFENHNGGQLAFGPDGYLYIGMGDGGSGGDPFGNGQNLKALLGKILRIDVHPTIDSLKYGIPRSNPFADDTTGPLGEIYSYGMRNPWRFSFDAVTGKLWCGDVGQDKWEEVDIIESGKNYGWNVMEATHCYKPSSGCDTTGKVLPIWEYPHDGTGGQSISGGFVYRGTRNPNLVGKYVFADYVSGRVWGLSYTPGSPASVSVLQKTSLNIVSFGVDANNELYLCAFDGRIYTIDETGGAGVHDDRATAGGGGATLTSIEPTPTAGRAMISYTLDAPMTVRMTLHDVTGREIATLVDAAQSAGEHHVQYDAGALADAVYYCRLAAGGHVVSRPLVVTR